MQIQKIIENLQKQFPNISGIKPGAEWRGAEEDNSIFLGDAAEGGTVDGMMPAADYYEHRGSYENFGIHKKLVDALDKLGYFAEWYDAGTLLAYPV